MNACIETYRIVVPDKRVDSCATFSRSFSRSSSIGFFFDAGDCRLNDVNLASDASSERTQS